MKADIECHGCCVRKAEGLLEQYQVPDEKKEQVMEAVLETVKGAGAEESAPVMMARVMRILESEVGITDAYDIPKQRYNGRWNMPGDTTGEGSILCGPAVCHYRELY